MLALLIGIILKGRFNQYIVNVLNLAAKRVGSAGLRCGTRHHLSQYFTAFYEGI